jgi:arylsulfatase A-like enzyme
MLNLIIVSIACLILLSCQNDIRADENPNIILILADDMGYGDATCYNPESLIPTPNLDKLAADGIRFTDAHSPSSVCTPTRYGVLTGRYAWRSRLKRGVFGGFNKPLIEPGRVTVASFLKENGYATACIGKWHLGWHFETKNGTQPPADGAYEQINVDFSKPASGGPNDLGFDYFFGTSGCTTDDPPLCFFENYRSVGLPDRFAAVDPADEDRELLMVEGWRHEDADIEFKIGISENTLIIFTSDNGPREGINGHKSAMDFRGYKGSIWEGGHRVPFIAKWPGKIKPATISDEVTTLTDLVATLAAIIGKGLPDNTAGDSYNILPVLLGENLEKPIRDVTIHHSGGGVFAIRTGDWKLIDESQGAGYDDPPEPGAAGQLYNLKDDPGEQNNLYFEKPDIVAKLKNRLEQVKRGNYRGQ